MMVRGCRYCFAITWNWVFAVCLLFCTFVANGSVFHHRDLAKLQAGSSGPLHTEHAPLQCKRHGGFAMRREKRSTDTDKPSKDLKVTTAELQHPSQSSAVPYWSKTDKKMIVLTRGASGESFTNSTLYISKDEGATFTTKDIPGGKFIWYFAYPSAKSGKMMFISAKDASGSYTLFKSKDEGETLTECGQINFYPSVVRFHPQNDDWLFVYDFKTFQVHVSLDFCSNWQMALVDANPRVFWDTFYPDSAVIHAEIVDLLSGGCRHMMVNMSSSSPTLSKFDPNIGLIEEQCLYIDGDYSFVQKLGHMDGGLYVSYRRGPYRKAFFPLDHKVVNFQLINWDEGQVFLAASQVQGHVNLYTSDPTGQEYILSLEHLRVLHMYGGNFIGDLMEVSGVKGVYIVNQEQDNVQTKITYDMGSQWSNLKAPPSSCRGCNVHLHIYTTSYQASHPQVNPQALGLIIARGMVGTSLNTTGNFKFLMSHDVGLTWTVTSLQGDHFIDILDEGSALVALQRTDKVVNNVSFSSDDGRTWTSHIFSSKKVYVSNMLNEPGTNTTKVSIFSYVTNSSWFITTIDFKSLMGPDCKNSDYQQLPLHDMVPNHVCLLGEVSYYQSRKENRTCFNGENFDSSLINKKPCPCIAEDYECDYGWVEDTNNCVRATWWPPGAPITCEEGQTYVESTGYRKVASDQCVGNLSRSASGTPKPCPIRAPSDLRIEALNGTEVGLGSKVTFQLIQSKGSISSTKYTWDFGDKTQKKTQTGLETARCMQHTYREPGVYTVKVTANNVKGTNSSSITITVEDVILRLIVRQPRAAMVQQLISFYVYPFLRSKGVNTSSVHYVWTLSAQEHGVLQWDNEYKTQFDKTGPHHGTVQSINTVSSKIQPVDIMVYADVVVIQLSFSDETETYPFNTENMLQRRAFEDATHKTLVDVLHIAPSRLDVQLNPVQFRTLVDVSFLPVHPDISHDPDIHVWAQHLVELVNSNSGLKIDLDENSFGRDENIRAVHAEIVHDVHPASTSHGSLALYIGIPGVIVLVVIIITVGWLYRGKCRIRPGPHSSGSHAHEGYRVLRSQSATDGQDDALLEPGLDEDDDPMLQPHFSGPTGPDRLVLADDALQDPLGALSSA